MEGQGRGIIMEVTRPRKMTYHTKKRKNKAYVLLSIVKSLNCQFIGEIKSKLLMLMKKAQNFMKLLTATFSLGFVIEKLL